jgi:8-oxo-dGTP diphosphatase
MNNAAKSARRPTGDPTLAAGGIVLQTGESPRIAVVRLRKRSEWVLPKGKLDEGETARQAAEREVLEETGHAVVVHEFLGTLAYASAAGSKAVHFWRMEAEPAPSRPLMKDVKEVDWLPLEEALERLSRNHERAFLAEVGPQALHAANGALDPDREPPTLPRDRVDKVRPLPSVGRRLWSWLRGR